MIRRRSFLAGAAAAAATGVPAAARAAARPLTIAYVPSTLFAPVFVAVDRGFVANAGFDPSLTPIVAGQDAMALVAQGQVDAVAAGLSAAFFNAVARGLDVKFVGSTGYQPRAGHPTALMIREDLAGTVRDVGGLRGRKVGWIGGAGAVSAYYIARILRRARLTLKDIETVNIANPDQAVALDRKAIDAVFTSSPFTSYFADRKLARFLASVEPGISGTGIFFGATLLRDQAAARSLMSAFRRGGAIVASAAGYGDPRTIASLAKYTQLAPDAVRRADRYDFKPDLRIDEGTLEDMQREFVRQNILTYPSPLNEVRLVARF